MDPLERMTGIDNLAVTTAESILEEGLVAAAQTMVGIAGGGIEASRTRLDASKWVLEFYLGRGKAVENAHTKADTDWERALAKMASMPLPQNGEEGGESADEPDDSE